MADSFNTVYCGSTDLIRNGGGEYYVSSNWNSRLVEHRMSNKKTVAIVINICSMHLQQNSQLVLNISIETSYDKKACLYSVVTGYSFIYM